ncbi:MAG: hypothetical protein IID51_12905, partial [Proteobacteria bacterium]|nr:hypothetical protein [Pseudomonadota bacterium]
SQTVEFVNLQAEKILNARSSDVVGKHMNDLKIISQFPWLKTLILKDHNKDSARELSLPESSLVFEVTVVPLQYEKEHRGVIMVFHDITREKQIELLKTEFVSLAAHQLRTPLSAMKWATQMLLDGDAGKLTEEQEELLQKSFQSTDRMIRLINDLLNVTRIEEGRYLYRPTLQQIGDIIKNMVQSYQDTAKQKKIRLELKMPQKEIPRIVVDMEKIQLVIQNLLENALHYTSPGGEVTVELHYDTKEVRVSFEDTGIGIPVEQQEVIFERFTQADPSPTRVYEGTGLGLSISKQLVMLMGGRIWVESEVNRGSTFYFTLSFEACREEDMAQEALSRVNFQGIRILVADDNATNCMIAEEMLTV